MVAAGFKATFGNTPVLLRIIALNLGVMSAAMIMSWSSPCLPKLDGTKDPQNNPLPKPITKLQKQRLVTAPLISALLTYYLPPFLSMHLRRRFTCILLLLPNIIGLLIIGFSYNFWMLYAGRLICGVTYTSVIQIVPRYCAELSLPQHRGAMACFVAIFITLGHLASFSIGPFVSFATFNQISLVPSTLLVFLLVVFINESPYDLIEISPEKAMKILNNLRRASSLADLVVEIEQIREFASKYQHYNFREFCSSKDMLRTLAICCGLLVFTTFTGFTVMMAYLQEIFTEANVPSPELAAIYVGIAQFFSTFLPPLFITRMSRKAILAGGQALIMLCLCTFATYNTILEQTKFNLDSFRWVPVTSICLSTCFYFNTLGLVAYVLMGELFPPQYKIISGNVSHFFLILSSLVADLSFSILVEEVKLANTFWFYAGVTFIGLCFIILFIPEPKAQRLREV